MSRNKVVHFFGDVSMTNGHDGLTAIADAKRVDVDNLKPGEYVAFINVSFTAMKLLCANGILVYWRQPSHRALFKEAVTTLPRFMYGEDVSFTNEVKAAIARQYKKFLGKAAAVRKLVADRNHQAAA